MVSALTLLSIVVAFVAGFAVARRLPSKTAAEEAAEPDAPPLIVPEPFIVPEPSPPRTVNASATEEVVSVTPPTPAIVSFDPIASRGTRSVIAHEQSTDWRAEMLGVGERFASAGVCAIVFVHGTFVGTDPLSAYRVVERALPARIGALVARVLRKRTRELIERFAGDLGNFGATYVRLFEEALRPTDERIPCTEFVWSSENHHLGRLEGALDLIRVLAAHAELGGDRPRRLLVIGHSHAGQIFALATQLLARSMATEAILDVARARGLDVGALETDLETLCRRGQVEIDFLTFGAPNRYAWASVPNVRALHVVAVPTDDVRGVVEGDWIRRLGVEGSDFPPLVGEERRINAKLSASLGDARFAPAKVAMSLREGTGLPAHGETIFVEYRDAGLLANGMSHGAYTRLDAMLFHARLVAERLYAAEQDR